MTPLEQFKHVFFIIILCLMTIVISIPVFTYVFFAKDLENKDTIMNRNDSGIILLDRNNTPFFTFFEGKLKKIVSLSSISQEMQNAVIASEDKDFYRHPGFSITAIIRSLYLDIMRQEAAFGGSTITQQLVKNVLLYSNKSFLRKYQEIVLAQEIERRYTKKEILEMYLNSVYFGNGAVGVENAAQIYFGISASELNTSQASYLVSVLPSPSVYSSLIEISSEAKARQQRVLEQMRNQGYLTGQEVEDAREYSLTFDSQKEDINSKAPHFALYVRDQLLQIYGEERLSRSGFHVRTSLNLEWQQIAEQSVQKQVKNLAGNKASNGAAIVMDPKTGEILAMVGSINWYDEEFGKVNVTLAKRSPGSSFKPIVYADALEKRLITPATVLTDNPTTFPGNYKPVDYDRKYRGKVLARRALVNSLNIPAVDVMQKVGVQSVLDFSRKLGITTLGNASNYGLSLVLGTGEVPLLEMTNVYATFANKGQRNESTAILDITDKNGKNVYHYLPDPTQVIEPEVAFLISSILSDNATRAESFGTALTISRTAAVKTGTAEDYKDALTIGYTPSLVVGVWVGNNDNSPMDRVAGSLGPAPVWRELMQTFLQNLPTENFLPPPNVQRLPICKSQGLLSRTTATASAFMEYFIQGTGPKRYCFSESIPTITP